MDRVVVQGVVFCAILRGLKLQLTRRNPFYRRSLMTLPKTMVFWGVFWLFGRVFGVLVAYVAKLCLNCDLETCLGKIGLIGGMGGIFFEPGGL